MAYDELLAGRIRAMLEPIPGLVEKKMFGGVGFILAGNMACGINGPDLIVRVGPQEYDQIVQQPGVRVFDLTGRTMRGWVVVNPEAYPSEEALRAWVERGMAFAASLPPK